MAVVQIEKARRKAGLLYFLFKYSKFVKFSRNSEAMVKLFPFR